MKRLLPTICRTLLAACFVAALTCLAPAQTSQSARTDQQERLDRGVQELDDAVADIERRIDVARPTPGTLAILAHDAAPLAPKAQAFLERLAPRAAAIKARLDQLGAKANGESSAITRDREALQKEFFDADTLLKRARVLAIKAQQHSSAIAKRQRTLFTLSLFQRSTSILSPKLWSDVVAETPENVVDATRALSGLMSDFESQLRDLKGAVFWTLVGSVLVLYWPISKAAQRLIGRQAGVETPSDWQKLLAACWVAVRVCALTILAMHGIAYIFSFFAQLDSRLTPLFSATQDGVIRLAVATGLGRALLAPYRRRWRPLDIDDVGARRLIALVLGVVTAITLVKLVEAMNEIVDASPNVALATHGSGAFLVALTLTIGLIALRDRPEEGGEEPTAAHGHTHGYGRLLRGLAWALVSVIAASIAFGYITFGSFLGDQLIRVAAVAAILHLAMRLVDESCALAFQPKARLGHHLVYTVGLQRETLQQLAVVLSGIARLTLIVLAVLIVLAPWGMQSNDLSGNIFGIFFGFEIGDVTISIAGFVVAIGSFVLVLATTRALQRWLEDRYLPTTRLDPGLRNSIKTSFGYIGFVVAMSLAAVQLGVDFQKLAIVAGALSVGIGFGMQSIVNNFLSGLILLWERAIRVGDWVIVGADQGYVRKINVRSTEIETFDRAAVIVPNANLVGGVVKNLMRQDRTGRFNIDLTVNPASDAKKVREVLLDIARQNDLVTANPAPLVRFTGLTNAAMNFSLYCVVADVEHVARAKSDLYFEIHEQFRRHEFFDAPTPEPTTRVVAIDRARETA